MARFQAQTNAVLDAELEDLQGRLGLRQNQKADLLREIAAVAAWVVRQAEAGRRIEARSGSVVESLASPMIERLRAKHAAGAVQCVELSDAEAERLAEMLRRGFTPTPALRKALARISEDRRKPPRLRWTSRTG